LVHFPAGCRSQWFASFFRAYQPLLDFLVHRVFIGQGWEKFRGILKFFAAGARAPRSCSKPGKPEPNVCIWLARSHAFMSNYTPFSVERTGLP